MPRSRATNSAWRRAGVASAAPARPARIALSGTYYRVWRFSHDRAIARRLLLGHQFQPGAKVASLLKAGAIADRRHHGARGDWADPRHIDPDRGDGSRHPLTMRCTHRMLLLELRFTPPKVQQIRALSTAGPSHCGEAILPIFIGRGAPANFSQTQQDSIS